MVFLIILQVSLYVIYFKNMNYLFKHIVYFIMLHTITIKIKVAKKKNTSYDIQYASICNRVRETW